MNNVNDTYRMKGQTEVTIEKQGSIKYFGFSIPGLATDKVGWKIFIMDSTAGTKKRFPIIDGEKETGYELIWDLRTSYIYQ